MGVFNLSVLFSVLFVSLAHCDDSTSLFDFTKTDHTSDWVEQSDTVRPVGLSKAVLTIQQNQNSRKAIFFALLNPQPDGSGFAGVRILTKTFNLSAYKSLQIQSRGQGQFNGFKIVLRHKGQNNEPYNTFEQRFQAPKDEFAVITLPLSEFKAYFRGKEVDNETLDTSQITSIGIQFYGGVYLPEKQKGPATLEIDWIKAVA